jgi:pimeloyl-ACP methyl ester carboxylesterase
MTQSHSGPFGLKGGRKTKVLLSSAAPQTTACVFVHGFGGTSVGTWENFPGILLEKPEAAGYDLIFYGYDSKRSANTSAIELLDFLTGIFTDPATVWNKLLHPSRARPAQFAYKRIVIVAHSLGAVVTRRALLDALWRKQEWGSADYDWVQHVRLVLFAPAHCGARVQRLAASFTFPFKLPVFEFFHYRWPSFEDLKPESKVLERLSADTTVALKSGSNGFLKAKNVLWATDETVVYNDYFVGDPPPRTIVGTHTSVCKPHKTFDEPLKWVLAELK